MPRITSDDVRIRMLMSQSKITHDNLCETGEPNRARSAYERMKALVKDHPDEPDLVALLADSSLRRIEAYKTNNSLDQAKEIAREVDNLVANVRKTPALYEQVRDFLERRMAMEQSNT